MVLMLLSLIQKEMGKRLHQTWMELTSTLKLLVLKIQTWMEQKHSEMKILMKQQSKLHQKKMPQLFEPFQRLTLKRLD
jgi:hypothetical protein